MKPERTDRLPCPWRDEAAAVRALQEALNGHVDWTAVKQRCTPWVEGVRRHPGPIWAMESLLHEFPLSSHEGLALMRLAEALLRVPDADTALALTIDQLRHPEQALPPPPAQGLVQRLSHRVLELAQRLLPDSDRGPHGWLQRLGGQTVVAATIRSVQLLGRQFVLGQTVDEALSHAQPLRDAAQARGQRLCFSIDMLGEGARNWADAERYLKSYQEALTALARHGDQDGLSIKLSALHPRFEGAHTEAVLRHLIPPLHALALQAARADVLLTLDAEESWRLELQLDVLEALMQALAGEPETRAWSGLGLAVQAYQLRAPEVIDEVARLATLHQRRLTVRLVKGAYWDSEIKRAQELGLPGFAVFTRKAHTDVSYLACARQLLGHRVVLSPQFATHNALTVAAVMQLAHKQGVPLDTLEWQRLHGMGEATWREILADPLSGLRSSALRVYAPVGAHRDLLGYLVRRLLENGANTSFVHQLVDPAVPLDTLMRSPLQAVDEPPATTDNGVAAPRLLYGPQRLNAWGRDGHVQAHRDALRQALTEARTRAQAHDVPAHLTPEQADALMARLNTAFEAWEAGPAARRCQWLDEVALRLERELDSWAADLVLEGHKSWPDAVAEVREAIDYAHYYAQQARESLVPRVLPGPTGEHNEWRLRGRGVWVCIAPWNFPLAIFAGQVMAALVMGNTVAAKPSEQTPRVAARFIDLLHELGVPKEVVALVPGLGAVVGHALVAHPQCAGVAFTGSEATARQIQRTLMERPAQAIVPLIAETGGINALIADSTALPEQLLDSVIASAFGSAGQRCSALRLLCLHQSTAHAFEALLAGALSTLVVGDPAQWCTDVGPVIDGRAQARLHTHLTELAQAAQERPQEVRCIGMATSPTPELAERWHFVTPVAYALPCVADVREEHFGPILHVVHWGPGTSAPTLDALIDQLNATGFGLTLGVHTRIYSRAQQIAQRMRVGNVYVNRGMTGAVVGVQPFGGQGHSGTGPKAGGPLYLLRFATEQVVCINTAAAGGNAALMTQVQ